MIIQDSVDLSCVKLFKRKETFYVIIITTNNVPNAKISSLALVLSKINMFKKNQLMNHTCYVH